MILAATLLALLLLTALLASGDAWSNVLSPKRNDLVFAGRHQAYGAYVIRQEHHRVMVIAFSVALLLVGSALVLPRLLSSAPVAPPPSLPMDGQHIIDFVPPDPVASTAVEPPSAPRTNPDNSAVLVAIDSVIPAIVDTATTKPDPDPKGPIGPVGPVGPVGPEKGKLGGERDTTVHEGWQADTSPEYPGGLDALYADLKPLVHFPQVDLEAGRQGKVYVSFVVTEDGALADVVVSRGVSPTMDAEAKRAVGQLKKRWKPGLFQGKEVRVRYNLPIAFRIGR